ncbi:hypothetical protein BJV77DRAFT_961451 [Russula vinacea]|nr:hypothetical protein BJV77DRAFT_961451 [Russula vinacea]
MMNKFVKVALRQYRVSKSFFSGLGRYPRCRKKSSALRILIVCGSLLHLEMANSIPTQDLQKVLAVFSSIALVDAGPLVALDKDLSSCLSNSMGEWVGEKWKQNTTAMDSVRPTFLIKCHDVSIESTRPPEWEFISRISSGFCWFQGTQKPGTRKFVRLQVSKSTAPRLSLDKGRRTSDFTDFTQGNCAYARGDKFQVMASMCCSLFDGPQEYLSREMTDHVKSSSIHDKPRGGVETLNTSLARSYKLVRPGDQTRPGLG